MTRHFLETDDLSPAELVTVLDLSEKSDLPASLSSRSVALLFEKPSARTRHSSEAAVAALGGHPVYTRPEEVGIDTRESAEDIARTLSLYHAVIAARVFEHTVLERMASVAQVPVINLLSDRSHPVQTLADLLTIRQQLGSLEGKTISFIGDASNVAFSLAIGAHMTGARFILSCPDEYMFSPSSQEQLVSRGISIEHETAPSTAARAADVIYTDAWYSMGQEDEKEIRTQAFGAYQVNDDLMGYTKESTIFMHCLPAHRGYEVTNSVLDGPQSVIWKQAENRMHTMRGLLSFLFQ